MVGILIFEATLFHMVKYIRGISRRGQASFLNFMANFPRSWSLTKPHITILIFFYQQVFQKSPPPQKMPKKFSAIFGAKAMEFLAIFWSSVHVDILCPPPSSVRKNRWVVLRQKIPTNTFSKWHK